MTSTHLYEAMQGLDDELLARSERPARRTAAPHLRVAAAAACLSLALTAVYLGAHPQRPHIQLPADPSEQVEPPAPGQEVVVREILWNDADDSQGAESAHKSSDIALFAEALRPEELSAACPYDLPAWADATGSAVYDGAGALHSLQLDFFRDAADFSAIQATLREAGKPFYPDLIVLPEPEPVVTEWDGFTFTARRARYAAWADLSVEFERSGVVHTINASGPLERCAELEEKVGDLLAAYAATDAAIDLDAFTMHEEHVYQNERLTHEGALSDPDFGAHFLAEPPAGWQSEGIRRYRHDGDVGYLTGTWTHGYDSLSWLVSYCRETDAARLTDIAATENYDLALYPIPRADSVPADKREIVNDPIFRIGELSEEVVQRRAERISDAGDTDGWRMSFSVLYEDGRLVRVTSKGVSPAWLYDALRAAQ